MKHFYRDVPGIGHVALSRHAQARLDNDGITEAMVEDALFNGRSVPDGSQVIWREKDGVRLVVMLFPQPFRGAALVTTGFRVERQARVK
jgi:hypothetical protein